MTRTGGILPQNISPDAEKVIHKLTKHGYTAYLVGGCVRDLLLDLVPKDFDVVTNARPNEIRRLFRNSRIIGRRFLLVHVFYGTMIIETSTFRAKPIENEPNGDLLIQRDNVFGSEIEDAHRREFTINALYYDVEKQTVVDHVGGVSDLENRIIRSIGNPETRFCEDPVRMLRAVRFAAKLSFSMEESVHKALHKHKREILRCTQARLLEEFYRFMRRGAAACSIQSLLDYDVLSLLSPSFHRWMTLCPAEMIDTDWRERRDYAQHLFTALDGYVKQGNTPSNSLILSCLIGGFVIPDLLDWNLSSEVVSDRAKQALLPFVRELGVARRDFDKACIILALGRKIRKGPKNIEHTRHLMNKEPFPEALVVHRFITEALGENSSFMDPWEAIQGDLIDNQQNPAKKRRVRRRWRRGSRRPIIKNEKF